MARKKAYTQGVDVGQSDTASCTSSTQLGMQTRLQVAAARRRAAEIVDLAGNVGAFGATGA